jgi:hypothetical protein
LLNAENAFWLRRFPLDRFAMTAHTITLELPRWAEEKAHPERACEPLLGSDDGKWIFESIFAALKNKTVAAAAA